MPALRCSVVICTWNRARLLDRTLAALAAVRVPADCTWEMVLVDNSSTDDTPAVAERHARTLPLRYVVETRLGISHARNRALEAVAGELILWTDDDVLVDSGWLEAHVAARRAYPDAAFQGGPIRPWYLKPPPRWLDRNIDQLGTALALRDLGPEERPITKVEEAPFGANMALPRRSFERLRFDPELGRVGNTLVSGEETLLFRRLLEAGGVGRWVPAATVRHAIPAWRLSRRYMRAYHYGIGRSMVRELMAAGELPDPRKVEQRWRKERRKLLFNFRHDTAWAEAFKRTARLRGMLDELTR